MGEKGWQSQEFADSWKKRSAERRVLMADLTEAMFDAAELKPGCRVLDLGTGTGDTALLAVERVGAGGSVLATDASPSMVEAARQAVAQAGVANVVVKQMDAAAIAVDDASFDAVIARMVLMFVDRPKTFAGVLRALRPAGRLAAAVWGPVSENPYHAMGIEAGRSRGGWKEDDPPQVVRAFSVNEPGAWQRWLREAGFADVRETIVRGERRYGSVEEAYEAMRESPIQADPIERLGDEEKEDAWAEIREACERWGGVFPTMQLVVSGRRPA